MNPTKQYPSSPHVSVCVDKSRSYGRGVLLGVSDYLELMGPWSIYVDQFAVNQLSKEWLRRWKGDAILAYVPDKPTATRLQRAKFPVVDVAGEIELPDLPSVLANDHSIGRLAGEHFQERQFQNFAYVGPGNTLPGQRRYEGFVSTVGEQSCHRTVYPLHLKTLSEWEREQKKLAKWIQKLPRPIGIMAYSDPIAQHVLDACFRVDTSVPEEVAVIGVDNDEELCRLSHVPLSSVVSNPRRIGFEAAQLISQFLSGEIHKQSSQHITVEPLYVVTRRSTDVTAVEDPLVARALAYIRQNACKAISVADVAEVVGLPRRSLYRRFENLLGKTPHQELLSVRFKQVRVFLAETNFTLDKIAIHTGFRNASYLTTSFKREYGITPGDYRDRNQN